MECAAADLRTPRQHVLVSARPREGGQQGGVDVDDPLRKFPDEVPRHEPHEAREDDEVDAILPQLADYLPLEGLPVLPVRLVIDHDRGDSVLPGALDDGCPGDVADEDGEVGVEVPSLPRIDETLEARPPP